ncbi:MAG: hypothetical protein R6V33_08365 [Pelovirga sp.]
MNTVYPAKDTAGHDVNNFVHELNVFRRQAALYPSAHPKTLAGANKILVEFHKLKERSKNISLGITPDNLMFNGVLLDADNPSCRELGSFFSRLDIAIITFFQGLSATELIEFWQLISTRMTSQTSTALDLALKDHQIVHIHLTTTDYGAFTNIAADSVPSTAEAEIWNEFIDTLIPGETDTPADTDKPPIELLAQQLNNAAVKGADCSAITSKLVSCLLEQTREFGDGIGRQLYEFSKKLKPEIRQSFHTETLHALDQQPHAAEDIISLLPGDFINAALIAHSSEKRQLSARLTDLLSTFAVASPGDERQRTINAGRTRTPEEMQSHIELLLLEDHHNEYLPDNYQQALQKILNGEIQGSLSEDTARQYRKNLAEQMIEHQCCEIIFDLLEADTDSETQDFLQNNLIDLSQFFLDTGDFQALHKALSRWLSFINSGRSQSNLLTEKFFSSQLERSFMDHVLNSVPTWHNEKYTEICAYLAEVGEPYVEPLIERLRIEADKEVRKTWMSLLLELGDIAHSTILEKLNNGPWYLLRNLLMIMGQQKGKIPPKALITLSKHPHPEVRCEALRILFRVNPSTANRLLLTELENENPQTLNILIPLTAMSNNSKVFTYLNRLLESEPLTMENLEIKLTILAGLATAPQPACLLPIMRLASRREFFVSRLRKQLKSAASETLRAYPRQQIFTLFRQFEDKQQTTIRNILATNPPTTMEPPR